MLILKLFKVQLICTTLYTVEQFNLQHCITIENIIIYKVNF